MRHDESEFIPSPWKGVGYYPTPESLVTALAEKVVAAWVEKKSAPKVIRVLDACAADGRIGFAVRDAFAKIGISTQLTLLEVDPARVPERSDLADSTLDNWVVGNFLEHVFNVGFDVVVSNPPYLSLNKKMAATFQLDWSRVARGGMNLYGMALLRALEVCRDGGIVGLIAPHGWVRNARMVALRDDVDRLASAIKIYATKNRREFPGVTQDASVQIFTRNSKDVKRDLALRVSMSYPDAELLVSILGPKLPQNVPKLRVRVGPFVWNREGHLLGKDPLRPLPVIYGGNIAPKGEIDYSVARYMDRQYLDACEVPPSYISCGPCIAIKRSMRGGPGQWAVDCSYVSNGHEFVAENHVIIVSGLRAELEGVREGRNLATLLSLRLAQLNRNNGHPNLSSNSVRLALSEICQDNAVGLASLDRNEK